MAIYVGTTTKAGANDLLVSGKVDPSETKGLVAGDGVVISKQVAGQLYFKKATATDNLIFGVVEVSIDYEGETFAGGEAIAVMQCSSGFVVRIEGTPVIGDRLKYNGTSGDFKGITKSVLTGTKVTGEEAFAQATLISDVQNALGVVVLNCL